MRGTRGIINLALNEARPYARVVELADSLDSGSSVQYARAGSSPASRTKQKRHPKGCRFSFGRQGVPQNPPYYGVPGETQRSGFVGGRSCSGMSEPWCLHRGEGYEACGDAVLPRAPKRNGIRKDAVFLFVRLIAVKTDPAIRKPICFCHPTEKNAVDSSRGNSPKLQEMRMVRPLSNRIRMIG